MSDEAIRIDGSEGEGGGQVLRTALGMSAVTGKGVVIDNIRANRPNPGLARQHIACLELMKDLCGAEAAVCDVGSTSAAFSPGKVRHGNYCIDVGSAGSVTLVLQPALLALASVSGESVISLTGGTDVRWAPPADYYTLALFPLLESIGLECSLEIGARGYYPRGGGLVTTRIRSAGRLEPLALVPLHDVKDVRGVINITGLPLNIAERVRDSALGSLPENLRMLAHIDIEHRKAGPGQGIGIVLSATDGRTVLGSAALGERGKTSEAVGIEATGNLMADIVGGGSVDLHASDQLLPFLTLASGRFSARELTGHAGTNCATIGKFLGQNISVKKSATVEFSRA